MSSFIDTYGFNPQSLLTSTDEVWSRLHAILSDRVLRFNPYTVEDETLLACAERGRWQPLPSITQMVVFHFHDIKKVEWKYPYEAISCHIGNDKQELQIPLSSLTEQVTYTATRRLIHVTVDGKPLTNRNMVEKMQGKDYFVSHALMAQKAGAGQVPAYRMSKLKGNQEQRADTIRISMVMSKIAMLKEIMANPHCPDYLQCSKNFIDYTTPIQEAISIIRSFSSAISLNDSSHHK